MNERRAVRVVIRGQVQGVGFRAWTQRYAQRHGLDGWVRNRRDGSVEAVFAGPPQAVEVMLQACARGPGGGRVEEIHVTEEAEWTQTGFTLRETL